MGLYFLFKYISGCFKCFFLLFKPAGSKLEIGRAQLADRLEAALFASRQIDANFLLPLLLEKATSHRPEARTDALALLADCVTGIPHVGSSFSDFRIDIPSATLAEVPIPIAHVTAYLFALCNMVKQLVSIMKKLEFDVLLLKEAKQICSTQVYFGLFINKHSFLLNKHRQNIKPAQSVPCYEILGEHIASRKTSLKRPYRW